jgi:hypothetical protein
MELFLDFKVLILLGASVLLHVLVAFLPAKVARVLSYVNILWHVALVILLSFMGKTIEEAVLVYLISVFVYTLLELLHHRLFCKASDARECDVKEGEV